MPPSVKTTWGDTQINFVTTFCLLKSTSAGENVAQICIRPRRAGKDKIFV